MLVLEWKGGAFIEKVNSRCFCWFPAAILVDRNCPPIWCLHTKLYKGAWNVSATNSETVGHKDLRFGQIVYILVFYNIHFLGFFHWTVSNVFFCSVFIAWQWKRRIISWITQYFVSSCLKREEHRKVVESVLKARFKRWWLCNDYENKKAT